MGDEQPVHAGQQDRDDAPDPKGPVSSSPQWVWTTGITLLIALCCVGAYLGSRNTSTSEDLDHDAKRVCEDFVKKRLKAPSTADFSAEEVTSDGDMYTVQGDVDAQNSFGAQLRSHFTCAVRSEGDQWKLQSITGLT